MPYAPSERIEQLETRYCSNGEIKLEARSEGQGVGIDAERVELRLWKRGEGIGDFEGQGNLCAVGVDRHAMPCMRETNPEDIIWRAEGGTGASVAMGSWFRTATSWYPGSNSAPVL